MGEGTLDRRIRKTRKLLRDCLTELLQEKKIQDITVKEITEKADINRGTFYLHYKDMFDLMEQIEGELLEELEEVLVKYEAQDLVSRPSPIFREVYQLVQDNSELVALLIGDNGDLNFVNRLKAIVKEKCLKDWMELFRPDGKGLPDTSTFEAYYAFTVAGCIGLVQYWLDSGMKETPEQLAGLTELIILKGIHMFEEQRS